MSKMWSPWIIAASFLATASDLPTAASEIAPTLEIGLVESNDIPRIVVDIARGEQSYAQLWEAKFAAMLTFCDLDANGILDPKEVPRLPSARALREASSSGFAPVIGAPPAWSDLDQNNDGQVTLEELSAYYRKHDVGTPTFGIGVAPFTAELNAALTAHLDRNGDGQVSLAEWQQAESIVEQMDQNDDQLIGAGELVAGIVYPGTSGSYLLEIPQPDSPPLADSLSQFPLTLFPARHDDLAWTARLKSLADFPKRLLDEQAVIAWRDQATNNRWRVAQSDNGKSLTVSGVGEKLPSSDITCLKLGTTWLTVRSDRGQLDSFQQAINANTRELFQAADTNQDGNLSREEWSASGKGFGSAMAQVLDRNGDESISQEELEAWLSLQQEIGSSVVVLTAIDCGNGVVELLDTDRNGALSRSELAQAASRLEAAGCVSSGNVDLTKLPRQVLVTISLGPPDSPLGRIQRLGPDWFLSMDRNLDGDVSQAEFIGGEEAFQSLDANGDKRITIDEVER